MKKVCLVGCGTIGRLHAKNLVSKVELSFHSRTQASAEALSHQCGGGQVFASYADSPRQRGRCGADQLATGCASVAGRRRIGSRQGSAGGKAVVRHSRRFGGHWRGRGVPSRCTTDDRGKLLLQALAQAAQVDHPTGFYRPSATGDPWQALHTADHGMEKWLQRAAGGRDPLRGPRSGSFRRRAPAGNRGVSQAPTGRAGAEFYSAGRIPLREPSWCCAMLGTPSA